MSKRICPAFAVPEQGDALTPCEKASCLVAAILQFCVRILAGIYQKSLQYEVSYIIIKTH